MAQPPSPSPAPATATAQPAQPSQPAPSPLARLGQWVESAAVQRVITLLILLNGVSLGLETAPSITAQAGPALVLFDRLVLAVFVVEIAAKVAYRRAAFFRNGWNVFDFTIVAIALLPASGPFAVLRALRILRLLRLLSVLPQLRRVVTALLTAVPGMLSVVGIILLLFYVGAVLSTKLFGSAFPDWFGTIGLSMYTLFQLMTLESWSMGIVRPVMEVYPLAWAFFVPFIIVTSFAILNLFIGIIVESVQAAHDAETKAEAQARADAGDADPTLRDLRADLGALRAEIAALRHAVTDQGPKTGEG